MKLLAMLLPLTLVSVTVLAGAAGSGTTTRRDYALAEGVVLQLEVPDAWQGGLGAPAGAGGMPTVQFGSEVNPRFHVVLTPLPLLDPNDAEETVKRAAAELGKQSTESNPTIIPFSGDHGSGWYFAVTDKQYADSKVAPGPGEYKYLAQGTLQLGKQTMTAVTSRPRP
jgi:hypothetical protein